MPLTPLPEDNTKRYKMIYTVGGQNHSLTARADNSVSDSAANTFFADIMATIVDILSDDTTWVDLEVAAQGSNVFNSTGTWTPASGTGGTLNTVDRPRALCFPGRTTNGRKTKAFIYGLVSAAATPATYEEDPLVTADFQGFQGLLNSQSNFWLGIDGLKPTWYFRVNYKTNDHWVDKARI